MDPGRARIARWEILGVALLFSTGGAAIKAVSLDGWQVACFRSGIAALAVLAFLPAARRGHRPATWLVGAAYAGAMVFFATANKLTTAANAIFLQSTTPLYLAALGPLLLGERIRRRDWLLLPLFAAGLAAFFAGSPEASLTAPDPARGNLLALASGLSFALTLAGLRWLGRQGHGGRGETAPTIAAGNLVACVACLNAALPVTAISATDIAILLYLGIIQIGFAYAILTRAIRHVSAFEASLLLLAEPVFNPLWAWLLHGERPGPWALAGGALILGASAAKSWMEAREARPAAAAAAP